MMNIRKKWIAGLLTVAMLFSLMPVGVLASEAEPAAKSGLAQIPFQANPLYPGAVDADAFVRSESLDASRNAETLAAAIYVTEEEAIEQACDYMKSRSGVFDIYVKSGSADYQALAKRIMSSALVHTGDPKAGDSLLWQYGGYRAEVYYSYHNEQYEFWYTFYVSYYTTKDQEAALDVAVDHVLSFLAVDGKSDYEKVCAVYDYVCDNVTYDYANLNVDAHVLKYTPYAALIDGTAVCQGYALLMYRLLLELGVDTRVVAGYSKGEGHAWNIVKLGDVYYNLDSTWDAGTEHYSYFLRSAMNFPDHTRALDYDSREFHVQYPMSATDYVDGVPGEPATVYAWGDCGDNAHWTLDMDGTLTVYGQGATYDYTDYGTLEEMSPWTYWMDSISALEVEDGITYLGEHTFSYMDTLVSVTLPDTLTRIGENAFPYCTGLTEITIPAGVTALDAACFKNCSALSDIYFKGDAPQIDPTAFTKVTADAGYPRDNATWTSDVMLDYGGDLTWIPMEYIEPEEPIDPEQPTDPEEPGETLGTFNGSPACVRGEKLHLCEVNFPDENFRSYIAQMDTDADGYLTVEEVSRVTTMACNDQKITSLEGVEFFTSLEELDCSGNYLDTLDVSRNTALVILNCASNGLSFLDLSKNTALEYLNCNDDWLDFLDLSNNTTLEHLDCERNNLSFLDLSKNTALEYLNCYFNDLDALDVSNNTALEYLDCAYNSLETLDVSNNTALETLYCYYNSLTSLDVSRNTALKRLSCDNSDLTALDVSKNTALEYLSCDASNLTSLDVSKNTALVSLYCENNMLTELDVSRNTALKILKCGNNDLTSLDVSQNTALETLSCHANDLTSLDVSMLASLDNLACNYNRLSVLDLSNNNKLEHASANPQELSLVSYREGTYQLSLAELVGSENLGNIISVTATDLAGNTRELTMAADGTVTCDADTCYVEYLYDTGCPSKDVTINVGMGIESNTETGACPGHTVGTVNGSPACVKDGMLHLCEINFPDIYFRSDITFLEKDFNADGYLSEEEIGKVTSIGTHIGDSGFGNVKSLKGVEFFAALKFLDCGLNLLSELDVSKNTALETLRCYNNNLTSLDVSKNSSLKELWCSSNNLSSLDVSRNTALEYLNCSYTELSSLDVSKNTALTTLGCGGNNLSSLDVSKNTALTTLGCGGNNLSSLDVSKNTALVELGCGGNMLSELDVSMLASLERLHCNDNNLTSLDVSKNTELEYLDCSNTSLTSLDVSKNTELEDLDCSNNNLTSLDVSKNIELEHLDCSDNSLTSLDVSKNTELKWLYCDNNNLTGLDVSKNTALYILDCSNNNLTSLNLSNNGELEGVYAVNQQLLQVSYREGTYQLSLAELVGSENLGNIISVTATDLAGNTRTLTMAADGTVTCDADTYYVEYLYDTDCPSLNAIMNVGMYLIPDVEFVGASLSLKGDIGLNYYVSLSERIRSDSAAYMKFTGSGADRKVAISKGVYDASDDSYRYSVALNAKNMGDDVTAQVYNANGAVGEGKTLSIKYYADYVINNSSKEVFVNLMKAMLNYGAAAQVNFGYDTENLVNADMTEADRALPATLDVAEYAHTWSGEEAGIEITSASLLLQSETKIRIYFKLAQGKSLDDFTFTIDGAEVTPVQSGDEYYIEKTNVAAKDLDTMYTFCLGNRQLTYCGLSYVNQVLNYSKDEKLLNLVKALYAYNQAANDYFGK